ncbi:MULTISPECIES: hypothetical protein [unclassified Variovorax]|uniref:hypothetical protein n=1 Tax=unclassified Variovorax TaxID=663243 RepID=UPI001BD49090|nr:MULTISPECIES: hypothetical protein [unclassified Variovorax]
MKRGLILPVVVLAMIAVASGLSSGADAPLPSGVATAGRSAFVGEKPLVARLPGHTFDLPAEAVRCINCHAPSTGTTGQTAFAPLLTSRYLNELRSRRGGPGSRYDPASFCRLLREGLDPAGVMVNTAMPRYDISPQGCDDLWAHLSSQ